MVEKLISSAIDNSEFGISKSDDFFIISTDLSSMPYLIISSFFEGEEPIKNKLSP